MVDDDSEKSRQMGGGGKGRSFEERAEITSVTKRLTENMRHSPARRWQRIRQRLNENGVAPQDAVLVDLHPEDVRLDFGLIQTRDGRAFSFELDFLKDQTGREISSAEDAWISSWEELDETGRDLYQHYLKSADAVFADTTSKNEKS